MSYYLVKENNSLIKALARQMLSGRWKDAISVYFLMYVILNVPSIMINSMSSSMFIIRLAQLYNLLVTGPMNLGIAYYFLRLFRQRQCGAECLFSGFSVFGKVVFMYDVISLKVLLYSLFFVIPGIYAAISYSQAYFILADHPEKGALDCLSESSAMMRGNMFKYLTLQLGFIFLRIIASFPSALSEVLLNPAVQNFQPGTVEEYVSYISNYYMHPVSKILSFLTLIVEVYRMTANACFHDLASGELASEAQEVFG